MTEHGVVLFHGTQAALRAEKVLKTGGLEVRLVPTPRHLSSDCGVALRFNWSDQTTVAQRLQECKIEVDGIHPLEKR